MWRNGTRDMNEFTSLQQGHQESSSNPKSLLAVVQPGANTNLRSEAVMQQHHYYHFVVRRWVFWTFITGVLFGISVLVNIETRTPRADLELALVSGAVFWILYAMICWAADAVDVTSRSTLRRPIVISPRHEEWADRAREEAIRSRAVDTTGEAHLVQ
jgi:hypothetical protein